MATSPTEIARVGAMTPSERAALIDQCRRLARTGGAPGPGIEKRAQDMTEAERADWFRRHRAAHR
jgi:hypothetical protein